MELNLEGSYVGEESRDVLERRDSHVWQKTSGLFSGSYYNLGFVSSQGGPAGALHTESPERKRASIPHPERAWCGLRRPSASAQSEKRTLDLVTDHPMIPREHLARWLGVSEGRVSQMVHSLVNTWGLDQAPGQTWRHSLHAFCRGDPLHHSQGPCRNCRPRGASGALTLTTDRQSRGHRRHVGHRIDTWARQTKHADGITWFLSKLEAEARADPDSELLWSVPTARSDRAYNWGQSAIAPDAVGQMTAQGLQTYRSTSSTSFAPVTPRELLPA